MNGPRLGATFRSIRIQRGLRQADLAARSGVSRGSVSRLERGHGRELTIDAIERLASALDASLDVRLGWHGGDLDRMLNSGHAAMHEAFASWITRCPGWQMVPEVSFSEYGERGVIDVVATHEAAGAAVLVELKTELVDVQDLIGTMDRRLRLAPSILRKRGLGAQRVSSWVLLADSRTNRRRVAEHATVLRAAFPVDGRSMNAWIAWPDASIRALSFMPNARLPRAKATPLARRRVRRARVVVPDTRESGVTASNST